MIAQGTVQRLVFGEGLPRTEHRTRDLGALFSEAEWGWSALAREAYVFPLYERAVVAATAYEKSAESHAAALLEAGELHVFACVHGAEARAAREKSHASRDAALDAQVRKIPPSPVYLETARRMGERES